MSTKMPPKKINKSCLQFKKNVNALRSDIMNDDILTLILYELNVKQLLRLEMVSKQFMDCVGSALKKKNGLSIENTGSVGHKCNISDHSFDGDITLMMNKISQNNTYNCIDTQRIQTLDSILWKCSAIKSLYIYKTYIDIEIIKLIANRCPQLKRLYFNDILFVSPDEELKEGLKELLSRVVHITLKYIDKDFVKLLHVIKELQSLESLDVLYCTDKSIALSDWLPQNIRCLKTRYQFLSALSLDTIINRCHQLEELSVCGNKDYENWNQLFAIICNSCKLKKFCFEFPNLFTHVFNENISKLRDLKHLSIGNLILNTNLMNPINNLKVLRLKEVTCNPNTWNNFANIFTNVRHLCLKNIQINCHTTEYIAVNQCKECVHNCLQYLSQLPHLRSLFIEWYNIYPELESKDLNLFKELNVICLIDKQNIDSLVDFCINCIANRVSKNRLKLLLDFVTTKSLLQRLNALNVLIPRYLSIGDHDNSKMLIITRELSNSAG